MSNATAAVAPFPVRVTQGAATPMHSPAHAAGCTRDDEIRLVRRAQAGDARAQEQLVASQLSLVRRIARRYRCRSHSVDDLVQEGTVGLLRALDRFDPNRGFRFGTYALHWVRQAIARAVELNDRLIHLPMQASADLRTLSRLRDEQHQKFGREPRADELAEASGIPEARILDLVSSFQETLSLDAMVGEEQDGSLLEMTTDPSVTSPEQDVLAGLYSQTIHRHIAELHPRERLVLEGRFGLHGRSTRTLEDIAGELRISRERVRQIELRAINRLRRALSSRSGD